MQDRLAYSTNAYMRFSMDDAIRRVSELGYAGVELMADKPHAWPATTSCARIEAIRVHVDRCGLSISNVNAFMMNQINDPRHPYWHPSWIEPDRRMRVIRSEHTRAALSMAAALGAPCITTEPGGPLEEGMTFRQGMDRFAEALRPVLEHAERQGVLLLVEPEPQLLIENAEQFEDFASRIDSPALGLNYDIGHFYCVGEPLAPTIRQLARYIRHVHVEDIAASRVHEHLVPGRGAIDFAEPLRALREIDYAGWITVELYPYIDDPDGAGREAREHLCAVLESLD